MFNVGERVYGCTSPLWVALLAAGMALGLPGSRWRAHSGLLAALGSVLLFFQLARRTLATPEFRGLADGGVGRPRVDAALGGLGDGDAAGGRARAGRLRVVLVPRGDAAGAHRSAVGARRAHAARGGVPARAVGRALIADSRGRPTATMDLGVAAPLLIYGGWLLFAKAYYGTPWPQTLAAKTAGAHRSRVPALQPVAPGPDRGRDRRHSAAVLVSRLCAGSHGGSPGGGGRSRHPRSPPPERATPAPAAPARTGVLWLLPWTWLAGVPVLYAGARRAGACRLPAAAPARARPGWRGAPRRGWWMGRSSDPARRRRATVSAAVLAAAVLAQNLAVYGAEVVPHVRTFSAGLERSLVQWGRWFGAHAPRDAAIATPDIGAIGYYSGLRVVDLAGLVTPAMVPLLERETAGGRGEPALVRDDSRAPSSSRTARRSRTTSCCAVPTRAASRRSGTRRCRISASRARARRSTPSIAWSWDCYERSWALTVPFRRPGPGTDLDAPRGS